MARRKLNRGRHTGRAERGEHFAQIPVEVLASEAYGALPDYAVRVLLAVAAQYRGTNNANISLTTTKPPKQEDRAAMRASARTLGVKATWKVHAGLQLLLDTGLLERTREGKYGHGKGQCALYALTWRAVNVSPSAYPPIEHERPAPQTWARWQRPDDWRAHETDVRRAAKGKRQTFAELLHDHSPRVEHASTTRGERSNGESAPIRTTRGERKARSFRSTRGGALLESGRGARSKSDSHVPVKAPSQPARKNRAAENLEPKIRKLIASAPDAVYDRLPERPWETDPDWRREPATVAATHADDRPHVPPVNASTGQSVHEYRPTETRVPANGDIDDRPQWPTNSPSETLPRTLSQEGALSRTPVPQSLKAKSPRGARPEPLAKTSASANSDPEVLREKNRDAISRLLSGGVTPYDITRMLAARGVTMVDIDAVRFPGQKEPT